MAEDKARDRVESGDSGRECHAVFRPQGPDAARMDFFNGLLRRWTLSIVSMRAAMRMRHREIESSLQYGEDTLPEPLLNALFDPLLDALPGKVLCKG